MKICDLTQFYSPRSGGVKRYVHEKIAFVQQSRPQDEHVLIIPGARTEVIAGERSRIYSIASPLVSRTGRYRILLNLRAIEEIIARERPDIIEAGDPYQIGWKALRLGQAERIPVVAFYHSHFGEAYLRRPLQRLGSAMAERMLQPARAYVRRFYNRFAATLVPSASLAHVLQAWGVQNTRRVELGVNLEVFHPRGENTATRISLGMARWRSLLLYVGRLAKEKNTQTLFEAFSILAQRQPDTFSLAVIGDGPQRDLLRALRQKTGHLIWIPYCTDSAELAQYYRAADLFVHPGVEETFGLVALESQACGTPVAGIRGSFMDEVILHDQSDWAGEKSAAALADAIETMSRGNLRLLGADAATAAQRYAWPRVFEKIFSIYAEVIASYRKA